MNLISKKRVQNFLVLGLTYLAFVSNTYALSKQGAENLEFPPFSTLDLQAIKVLQSGAMQATPIAWCLNTASPENKLVESESAAWEERNHRYIKAAKSILSSSIEQIGKQHGLEAKTNYRYRIDSAILNFPIPNKASQLIKPDPENPKLPLASSCKDYAKYLGSGEADFSLLSHQFQLLENYIENSTHR